MKEKNEHKPLILPPPNGFGYPIITDPMGSYTGLVHDLDEQPIQDADDL